jgi:hypothetical protein
MKNFIIYLSIKDVDRRCFYRDDNAVSSAVKKKDEIIS